MRGTTQKKFHLDRNLWVCGFRSACDTYDETREYYKLDKLKENPRFTEIYTELCCSFTGSYDMIPIEIIGNFHGFEEDDFPDESGWYLAICAKSAFMEETGPYTKTYNGPDMEWFKDAMLWWYENEPDQTGSLRRLANSYVNYCIRDRNKELLELCKYNTNQGTLNESITNYILTKYSPNNLIDFVNKMDSRDLYILYYFIDCSNFDYYLEYLARYEKEEKEGTLSNERRYDHKRHTQIAEMIDKEMIKYI
jgi:hypothetical protein